MARLTEEVLQEGRNHLTNNDIEGFIGWMAKNTPTLPPGDYWRSFERLLRAGGPSLGPSMAIQLFDKAFPDYDLAVERRQRYTRLGCSLLMLVAGLGGLVSWLLIAYQAFFKD